MKIVLFREDWYPRRCHGRVKPDPICGWDKKEIQFSSRLYYVAESFMLDVKHS